MDRADIFADTDFPALRAGCKARFGDEDGEKIYHRTAKLYAELAVTTDYKDSYTLERQLKRFVYPVIAYYKTLLSYGYRQAAALGLVRRETEKAADESGAILGAQMRRFFPYRAFRRNIKNFIEYKFPAAGGWKSGELKTASRVLSFRIRTCMYATIAEKFGCPELCAVFCDYERRMFAGLLPQVEASCPCSMGEGHDYCEFRFKRGHRPAKGKNKE